MKIKTRSFDAFESVNCPDIATIKKDIIEYTAKGKSIAKKEALLRKMKDEERNSSFINALLIILIPVIIFRLYQRDKEPRKKLPRKETWGGFVQKFCAIKVGRKTNSVRRLE